ncbi:LysE family transporter [Bacillus sp. AFS055030]|uniref:LysE family translocator n=1 Tax=Bacillus sp. AFS055030 TaxID=2033507 RepID=UPI000BFBB793|nr:LysE family transporter [Bacillus sp. AFS055030]PGL71554.1 lysine transporter LysE [Bacillus sp. AFS055030]
MNLEFYFKGLLIGLSIAAPVGPIGVLCIRRTLAYGRMVGLVSGLGAATADGIYGLIAGFGLTVITNFLIGQHFWIQLIGGFFLCYLGVKTLISKASFTQSDTQKKNMFNAFLSVLFLTLTNPMTILSFIAIFAGLGISSSGSNIVSSVILVLGVFCGSSLWWVILSTGVGLFRTRINNRSLTVINRLSGIIILIFGGIALYGLM